MPSYVHFMDGTKEEIVKSWTGRNNVRYVKTAHDTFMYKNVYIPNSALHTLLGGYDWLDLCYYKHQQTVTKDGQVIDEWVRAPIEKITYVRPKFKKHCVIPMLKNVLAIKNMTPADLSRVTGINSKTLIKYIDGNVTPRPATIERIAECLNIDISTLTGEDDLGLEKHVVGEHDAKVLAKRKEEAKKAEYAMRSFVDYINKKMGY